MGSKEKKTRRPDPGIMPHRYRGWQTTKTMSMTGQVPVEWSTENAVSAYLNTTRGFHAQPTCAPADRRLTLAARSLCSGGGGAAAS